MKPLILLIEDDETLCEDLRLLLPDRLELVWARGSEAVRRTLRESQRPAAIILDLCLSPHLAPCAEEEGFKLLDALVRHLAPGVPVLIVSAHAEADVAETCIALGAAAYMEKPCIIADLLGKLDAFIASGSRAAQPPSSDEIPLG